MRTSSTIVLAVVVVAPIVIAVGPAVADRGHMVMVTVKAQPNVSVRNEGQKAIIGWNGKEEVLILATDLSASGDAKVVEFLPLPSKPSKVAKADLTSFRAVEKIIRDHAPRVPLSWPWQRGGSKGTDKEPAVKIVFHKQIEAHDITIAKTEDLEAFLSWARDFVKKHGGTLPEKGQGALRSVIRSYLSRGYHYFVFDIIDLADKTKTVPPIRYRFRSDHLFFPLVASSLDVGRTEIDLFLLTPHCPDVWGTKTGFCAGFYRGAGPIKFALTAGELRTISRPLADLFKGRRSVQFTAATYKGLVTGLKRDFVLRAPLSRPAG